MIVIGIVINLFGQNFAQNWFRKTYFPKKYVEKNSLIPYSKLRYKFATEYDRENPVTQNMGRHNYKEFFKRKLVIIVTSLITKDSMNSRENSLLEFDAFEMISVLQNNMNLGKHESDVLAANLMFQFMTMGQRALDGEDNGLIQDIEGKREEVNTLGLTGSSLQPKRKSLMEVTAMPIVFNSSQRSIQGTQKSKGGVPIGMIENFNDMKKLEKAKDKDFEQELFNVAVG